MDFEASQRISSFYLKQHNLQQDSTLKYFILLAYCFSQFKIDIKHIRTEWFGNGDSFQIWSVRWMIHMMFSLMMVLPMMTTMMYMILVNAFHAQPNIVASYSCIDFNQWLTACNTHFSTLWYGMVDKKTANQWGWFKHCNQCGYPPGN